MIVDDSTYALMRTAAEDMMLVSQAARRPRGAPVGTDLADWHYDGNPSGAVMTMRRGDDPLTVYPIATASSYDVDDTGGRFARLIAKADPDFVNGVAGILTVLCDRADSMVDASPRFKPADLETMLASNIPGWRRGVVVAARWLQQDLKPLQRIGSQIMSRDPLAFNRDAWGDVVNVVTTERIGTAYAVTWPDGASDLWPVGDSYLFREKS